MFIKKDTATMLQITVFCVELFLLFPCVFFGKGYTKGNFSCSSENRCVCRQEGSFYKANCVSLSLKDIPYFATHVNWIDLSKNKLQRITPERIPQNIVVLILTENYIQDLEGFPFDGLTKLQILRLGQNTIEYTNTNFYKGIFKSLMHLKELDVKSSPTSVEKWTFPAETISELLSLNVLRINGLPNMVIPVGFRKLKNLQYLDISGKTSYCSLKHITSSFFDNVPQLSRIDVRFCNIRYIDRGVFSRHPNISFIDISHNRGMGLAVLPNVTQNFNSTKIKTFKFDFITCMTGVGTMLRHYHLRNLYNTSLTELSSSFNRIEQFEMGVLKSLPKSLKKLTMKWNRFTPGLYLFELSQLSGLEVADVARQYEGLSFPTVWVDSCVENPDIPQENKEIVDTFYSQDAENIEFITNTFHNMKKHRYATIYLPPKLKELYMYSSHFYGEVRMFGIHAENLKTARMYDNGLNYWKGPMIGVENITYLDLSNNQCYVVSQHFFENLFSVCTLSLSTNILGPSFSKDIDGNIFRNQIHLEVLDISINQIEYLPRKFFKNAVQMKSLILGNNKLSDWHSDIAHMTKLSLLDLSYNRISSFSPTAMHLLQRGMDNRQGNISIDLSGNIFACSCQSLNFLKWVAVNKDQFKNLTNYKCSQNDVSFQFSALDESVQRLASYCRSYLYIYLPCAIVLTLGISVLVGLWIHKNKWNLRYLIYKSKQKFRTRGQLSHSLPSTVHYEYDAYISYVGSDRSFVVSEIYQRLEIECGLKLLIRDKIFLPGQSKSTCIMEGLQESRKTVCVISKRYLSSKWRDYELSMAKVEGIKDRGSMRFVILILMPDVYNGVYPSKVMDLVKHECYLEYPDNQRGHEEFWEKLMQRIDENI